MHAPPTDDARSTVRIGPDGLGIDFEPLVEIDGDYTPEGLAYHDGNLYTGERDGPATIREYETDGTPTGREFTFDDLRIDHTNTMAWVDGNLWVSDSSTMKTYVVDWEELELVDEFDQADPVTGTWRTIVPTTDGTRKLLFNEWRGDRAWLVDLEDTLEDGTTAGNVDRELRNGLWTNPQTMAWHDSWLYTTTHAWIVKSRLPYADRLADGHELVAHDVEWAYEFADGDVLEQLVYDQERGVWYLVDRGGLGTIYRGTERYGVHRNASFSRWDASDGSIGGNGAIVLDTSGVETMELTRGSGERKVGWIDVWFFDSGSASAEISLGVVTNTNDEFAIGRNEAATADGDRYCWYDGTEWHETGIERRRGWIKFGWSITEDTVSGFVSRSHGRSWTEVDTIRSEDATINRLRIRQQDGWAKAGSWTLDLDRA
ncbi:hypothetical protein [Halopiger goleimassiliensis]|uniref:hypothetical protein n=1 Tax=Halopiger goleimassiliensis TaxID=1293048 RepID=UPI0012B66C10|nr:hypothetical protein [Halopiger goleimassiliensis]